MRLSLTFAMIRLDYLIWEMCGALTQSGVDFVWLECILYIELFTKLETKAILSHFIFWTIVHADAEKQPIVSWWGSH